jgi:hypothetical protein
VTLKEVLNQIDRLTEDDVIFAKRPWHMDCEAMVAQLTENFGTPASVTESGFKYFLDVPVAREVLEVFGSKTPSEQERRELLLHYAEYDGYPTWVYER